ncbi:hypothetical protein LDO31_05920 [Luteimonas sp. XNQY3]|nr:hypothetical protein [Luteimonas sp. XNQY3]MCD9005780.1 hypothetical protein [Luteimonas sp. XNQY3]
MGESGFLESARPLMSLAEEMAFKDALQGVETYVEFGCGGSSALALRSGVSRLYITESDRDWVARLRSDAQFNALERAGAIVCSVPDLGPIGSWGWPKDRSRIENWRDYSSGIWSRVDAPVDLVFVDGRFRVACTLSSILCSPDGQRIAVHDFWARTHYHVILDYLETEVQVGTLGVFRVKHGADRRQVFLRYLEYMHVPD